MFVNVVSFSSSGGAGNVAAALAHGFRSIGLQARFITAIDKNLKASPLAEPVLTFRASLDKYLIRKSTWPSLVSIARDRSSVMRDELPPADLTIFRWMNGLLGEGPLAKEQNIGRLVWGLDDMNPFTGACHYAFDCRGFELNCETCPAVAGPFRPAVSKNLDRKIQFANLHKPTFVAPTDWIHAEFRLSQLGTRTASVKIPNPLQDDFFLEYSHSGKSKNTIRVAVVAANLDDPTKGVWDVIHVLGAVSKDKRFELSLIGMAGKKLRRALPDAKFEGVLGSKAVRSRLQANHLLLVPSLSENAGTVVAEAASQGTPSVVRNVGGMAEMTNYGETGYLFSENKELLPLLKSLTVSGLVTTGLLAKEWSQQLHPKVIATQYAEAFL